MQILVFASMFLSLVKNLATRKTLSCYCTVLCAGHSTKESLNHLIHRACLRKNQETLKISVFSPILLNLIKNVLYFLFITLPFIEHVKKKLGDIPHINVWSYNFKFSEKNCFILPFFCNVLYTRCPKET